MLAGGWGSNYLLIEIQIKTDCSHCSVFTADWLNAVNVGNVPAKVGSMFFSMWFTAEP